MILKRVLIKNFRAIKSVSVDFDPHTVIVGGNGSGKSTILRAIERFYLPTSTVEADDFYDKDTSQHIDIELTFSNLSEMEMRVFASRTFGGDLTVARVFEFGARNNGRYYGSSLRHEGFEEIRSAEGAAPKRQAYDRVRGLGDRYGDLPPVTRADQIPGALQNWELAHPDLLAMGRDDGQFFGFTNVARGALQKCTSFVFIPAVREAADDAMDARGSAIALLMELVVRSAVLRRREVREWRERISREYRELTSPDQLPELGQLAVNLTGTLSTFYREAAVTLSWQDVQDLNVPLPSAQVALNDDGFSGPVDRKGHGLQRAFVLTLLQHLAKASAETEANQEVAADWENPDNLDDDGRLAVDLIGQMPGLILAIEEPELYQHPTKQRHFANVLRKLTEGALPGVSSTTQVVFASHSPLFVAVERFDELRLARRMFDPETAKRQCSITSSNLAHVAHLLERSLGKPAGSFTAASLRPRLHILGPELAEAFFADCVVLVEGGSDRAAIFAAAASLGVDLEAEGIAVLVADGKSKLDRPAAIFMALGIPTYVIWDCDGGDDKISAMLQALCQPGHEASASPMTKVESNWASFDEDLEVTLKSELGAEVYERHLKDLREEFSVGADAQKSPVIMKELLRRSAEESCHSATLEGVVSAIMALRDA